ncbi:MAG: E3 binding domain-containing protein, partial [Planctomycetes bacterium]|nr:E3 binding domain-containing protein [Planctomycetota bacterium]
MAIELKIPSVGESIKEVIIGTWMKKEGDAVEMDEPVVEVDSDKASQELGAPKAGVVKKLLFNEGDTVKVGEVIALIDENGKPSASTSSSKGADSKAPSARQAKPDKAKSAKSEDAPRVMPAARRLMDENNLSESEVTATGPGGRILKEDVQKALDNSTSKSSEDKPAPASGGPRETETVRMSNLRRRLGERLVGVQQT